MGSKATAAAIYCRISVDHTGEGLGVERQREDCAALCERRGWTVNQVFIDNDVSAFSGRRRPGYESMLEALEAGRVQALVAWAPDRLHRSPLELEAFVDLVNTTGAVVATCQAGEYDLATAAGRMTARVVGAVARHESEQKSERLVRQRAQAALQGRPASGGLRPFGYDATGSEVVEAEAKLIRGAVARILAGASVRSIANEWNNAGVCTVTGRTWNVTAVRGMLTGPRLAALRVHHGDVIGTGTWPAILTRDEHDDLTAALQRGSKAGRPPVSLLGGLATCARCGARLHHSRRQSGVRRYMCPKAPGKPGCGRLAINAEPVDQLITDAVLAALDSPALDTAIASQPAIGDDVAELERRLDELAELHGAGSITTREWLRSREGLQERLQAAQEARYTATAAAVLSPYVTPGALRKAWPDLATERRRSIIEAVLEAIVVRPVGPGNGRDPDERVELGWRV